MYFHFQTAPVVVYILTSVYNWVRSHSTGVTDWVSVYVNISPFEECLKISSKTSLAKWHHSIKSIQEDPSRHNWKSVHWGIKKSIKKTGYNYPGSLKVIWWQKNELHFNFVHFLQLLFCADASCPSQQFFSHFRTFLGWTSIKQWTKCLDSASGETQTCNQPLLHLYLLCSKVFLNAI